MQRLRPLIGVTLKVLSIAVFLVTTVFLLSYVALVLPDEFDVEPFDWGGFVLFGLLIAAIGFGAALVLRWAGARLMAEQPTVSVVVASAQPPPTEVTEDAGWNELALWAFVTGVGSVLIPIAGIAAVGLGIVALNQMNQRHSRGLPPQKGKWLAVTAIVVGVVTLALSAIVVFLAAT